MTEAWRKEELVSIIVPVYNAAEFLEETVQSVRNQTYEKWELLLVDDCSTDQSRSLIERFAGEDGRIRPVLQEKNRGAAQARNRGIREAAGRYIAFLDADDLWKPEKLEKELLFREKKTQPLYFPDMNLPMKRRREPERWSGYRKRLRTGRH